MAPLRAASCLLVAAGAAAFVQQPLPHAGRPAPHCCCAMKPAGDHFNIAEAKSASGKALAAAVLAASLLFPSASLAMAPAAETGASSVSDTKMLSGAASTLDTGSRKIITRGVTIENADFHGKDMSGVSFQQSLVRGTNFQGAKLVGAGFFDADLSNCDFTSANMNQANLEMANLKGAIMKNAVVTEAYVSGATKLEPKDIEGADFSDTFLRKDQVMYLCSIAKGTNPITKVNTAESLGCY